MPFTISHAAVVLPFSRLLARWRVLSAVIIGAMVPDFGLFLPWRIYRFETHSIMALGTFCLPVGLASYWLFQYLIKPPLCEVLPGGAYARWQPFASPADSSSLRQWLLAASGVLVGAVSHLFWDSFTHENARGVRMIPWIEEPIVEIGNHYVGGVRFLQDGSSLIGLIIVVIFIAYALRPAESPRSPQELLHRRLQAPERRFWMGIFFLVTVAATVAWFLWARSGEPRGHFMRALPNNIAVAALRGLGMALICTSLAVGLRLRSGARAAS